MTGPPPPVARVRAAVRDLLERMVTEERAHQGDTVLVACSGGPDSVALAAQLGFVAPRLGLRAGAAVVDHGLRPGSADVAGRAARTCRELGLDPVVVRRVAPTAASETAAREARYAALADIREATGAVGVLLGHTQDDQAETVLLALARGSGTRAVAGMAPDRGPYWRPLLGVRRQDTTSACDLLGLAHEHDPTNAADGPWRRADGGPVPRAAVRDRVLSTLADALGQDPVPALARTAGLARADADLLDELAAVALRRCTAVDGALDVGLLTAEPPALRTRVLRLAALAAGASAGDLAERHVRTLEALVTSWHGQGEAALPGGVVARRVCGRLVLAAAD